jgi:predicted XRE-type DNA-binding protein
VATAKRSKRARVREKSPRGHQPAGGISAATKARSTERARGHRGEKPLIPKEELAEEIATIIRYHHLSQSEAARIVGDAPSQMSLLLSGRIEGFSVERLLRMLLRLGRDIELVFRPAEHPRAAKFRIRHKSSLNVAT